MSENKNKPTAVVVNDDTTQLGILSGLARKAGLEPLPFTGAEAALAAMNPDSPPDIIVTDLYMPGLDGWRFCRLLRSPEYAAFNEIPILVVSATFAGDNPERIAADIGADIFLPSPVDGKEFVAHVKALLSGKEARRLPRALIVEDGKTLAGLLKKAFAAHGYAADTALSVSEAEAAFGKTAYDVAVLDYHLPDGTGDSLLDAFRARRPDRNSLLRPIPVCKFNCISLFQWCANSWQCACSEREACPVNGMKPPRKSWIDAVQALSANRISRHHAKQLPLHSLT